MKRSFLVLLLLLCLGILVGCFNNKTSKGDTNVTNTSTAAASTSQSSTTSGGQEQTNQEEAIGIDLNAIAQQDLSTLTGVWSNANGLEIEFKDDGTVVYGNQTVTDYDFITAESSPEQIAKLNLHLGVSGVAVYLFPMGVENPNILTDEDVLSIMSVKVVLICLKHV